MESGERAGYVDAGERSLPPSLVELQRQISCCADIGELLATLGSELGPLLPVTDRVSFVFLEPDGEWMRIYRVLPPAEVPTGPLPRVRVEGTPVGRVVREGAGRVVADVRADPNITFGHASHDRIRSTVSVPIRVGGQVVGAFNAGSRTPGACDERMMQELEELVGVIGPAIYAAEQVFSPGEEGAPPRRSPDEEQPAERPSGLVGRSASFQRLIAAARRAAENDVDVLITGETGVGKTALARAIHRWSERSGGPFITVHLADLSSSIVESELFGHERGAFTGALSARVGRFESAQGGTIFLDEVGEAEPHIQAKLLRVIQDRCFERVGGSRTIESDVRIIAATSRDLRRSIARGEFRQDLFYRLNVLPLHVPPLRERGEDLELLVEAILASLQGARGRRRLTREAWRRLSAHTWPGNIRELESVLRRATILEDGDLLELESFPDEAPAPAPANPERPAAWPTLEEHQRRYIRRVLEACGGVIEGPGGAAQLLGLRPSTLRSRMNRLGISAQPMREKGRKQSCDS